MQLCRVLQVESDLETRARASRRSPRQMAGIGQHDISQARPQPRNFPRYVAFWRDNDSVQGEVMGLAPVRRGEGGYDLQPDDGTAAAFAAAAARAKQDRRDNAVPAVPVMSEGRRQEIDDWVQDKVKDHTLRFWMDDGDETAAKALRGKGALGPVTAEDRVRMVDQLLVKWQGKDAGSALELAKRVRGDVDLARVVAERMVVRSAELQAGYHGTDQAAPELASARTYAEAAMLALGVDPEQRDFKAKIDRDGLQKLVGGLPPEQASAFAELTAHAPRALAAAVSALAGGPEGRGQNAFALGAFAAARDQTYSEAQGLAQDLGPLLAAALGQPGEGGRLGEILATPQGRKLLVEQEPIPKDETKPPEGRGAALALVMAQPGITASELLRSPGGDPWASVAVAKPLAQEAADRALQVAGKADHGIELVGAETLESRVAGALGMERQGEDGKSIDRIAAAIRDQGGADGKVTVLPVQLSSGATGAVTLPLFRVERADGSVRFVDNQGGHYDDFGAWTRENRLPPGNMTYPRDGRLQGQDGHAVLDSRNTPRTPDSLKEHIEQAVDKAALFGGVAAGGLVVLGTGGAATPVVAAGAGAWFAWRGGETAVDLDKHGLAWWDNPEYRMAVFNMVSGGAGVLPLGRLAYLARAGKTAEASVLWSSLNRIAVGADAAAAANTGATLAADWDKLTATQRLEMGLGLAMWGSLGAAAARHSWPSAGRAAAEPSQATSAGKENTAADGAGESQAPVVAVPPLPQGSSSKILPRSSSWKVEAAWSLGKDVGEFNFPDIRQVSADGRGVSEKGQAHSLHELVMDADATIRRKRDFVLDLSDNAANRQFAQNLADAGQVPVHLRREAGGWETLQPSDTTPRWSVEIQGEDLYRVEPDGTRHRIDQVESHLGERVGAGWQKTVFAFGDDKVAAVFRDGDFAAAREHRDMLTDLAKRGVPTAQPLALIMVHGRPALVFDRYLASSRDLDKNGVIDTTYFNENSFSSLLQIKKKVLEDKIDIRDMELAIGKDGRFVVIDPVGVLYGREPSKTDSLRLLDEFIAAAEKKLKRPQG